MWWIYAMKDASRNAGPFDSSEDAGVYMEQHYSMEDQEELYIGHEDNEPTPGPDQSL